MNPALSVACPACQAQPGQPCTTPTDTSRKPMKRYHRAREDAVANQVEDPTEALPVTTDFMSRPMLGVDDHLLAIATRAQDGPEPEAVVEVNPDAPLPVHVEVAVGDRRMWVADLTPGLAVRLRDGLTEALGDQTPEPDPHTVVLDAVPDALAKPNPQDPAFPLTRPLSEFVDGAVWAATGTTDPISPEQAVTLLDVMRDAVAAHLAQTGDPGDTPTGLSPGLRYDAGTDSVSREG